MSTTRLMRYGASALLLIGGWVHLKLYFDGYRDVPDANLGRSFLLNALASVVVAVAIAVRPERIVRYAGIAVAAGTLGAFALSRTDRGIFGFTESGLHPSPEALIALVAELGAIGLLVASLVLERRNASTQVDQPEEPRTVGVIGGLAVVATIVLAVVWNSSSSASVVAGSTTTVAGAAAGTPVAIADFSFSPTPVTVKVGGSVTWTNKDGTTHTVTATDKSFDSKDLDGGATFSHTFATAGTFTYACAIHSSMKGTVVVG
jgi:plastocyanin